MSFMMANALIETMRHLTNSTQFNLVTSLLFVVKLALLYCSRPTDNGSQVSIYTGTIWNSDWFWKLHCHCISGGESYHYHDYMIINGFYSGHKSLFTYLW